MLTTKKIVATLFLIVFSVPFVSNATFPTVDLNQRATQSDLDAFDAIVSPYVSPSNNFSQVDLSQQASAADVSDFNDRVNSHNQPVPRIISPAPQRPVIIPTALSIPVAPSIVFTPLVSPEEDIPRQGQPEPDPVPPAQNAPAGCHFDGPVLHCPANDNAQQGNAQQGNPEQGEAALPAGCHYHGDQLHCIDDASVVPSVVGMQNGVQLESLPSQPSVPANCHYHGETLHCENDSVQQSPVVSTTSAPTVSTPVSAFPNTVTSNCHYHGTELHCADDSSQSASLSTTSSYSGQTNVVGVNTSNALKDAPAGCHYDGDLLHCTSGTSPQKNAPAGCHYDGDVLHCPTANSSQTKRSADTTGIKTPTKNISTRVSIEDKPMSAGAYVNSENITSTDTIQIKVTTVIGALFGVVALLFVIVIILLVTRRHNV